MMELSHYLTRKVCLEVGSHENVVLEAYLDSVGVWTWGFGLTVASGHNPMRYRNNPSTLDRAVEVYVWALRRYGTEVLKAFSGMELLPHQFAAALSFHWNTGAIGTASWVKSFRAGNVALAKKQFMAYDKPAEIIGRRKKEFALFFSGKWSGNGRITQWAVKPNGHVNWRSGKTVDIGPAIDRMLAFGPSDGTMKDSDPVHIPVEEGEAAADPLPAPIPVDPENLGKPIAKSKTVWMWLMAAFGSITSFAKEMGFVALDWRVQIAIVLVTVALAVYAILRRQRLAKIYREMKADFAGEGA